ncbi:methyltransferase [archaeon]|jgi:release factor glutamine methyltransferase|nr:methyltransferase [archaeon]
MTLIYEPAEDSHLLSGVLEKEISSLLDLNSNLKVLEIGIGSGIQLRKLKEFGVKNISGVDINPEAVKKSKDLGLNVWESDLFSRVKEKYDLIIFNPPYLPKTENEDEESELITTGGNEGSEIINEFLKQAKEHLEKDGKIFLLISDLTKGINWLNCKKRLIDEKKLFFEKLEVWELS